LSTATSLNHYDIDRLGRGPVDIDWSFLLVSVVEFVNSEGDYVVTLIEDEGPRRPLVIVLRHEDLVISAGTRWTSVGKLVRLELGVLARIQLLTHKRETGSRIPQHARDQRGSNHCRKEYERREGEGAGALAHRDHPICVRQSFVRASAAEIGRQPAV
jgi:hypothetical protein